MSEPPPPEGPCDAWVALARDHPKEWKAFVRKAKSTVARPDPYAEWEDGSHPDIGAPGILIEAAPAPPPPAVPRDMVLPVTV